VYSFPHGGKRSGSSWPLSPPFVRRDATNVAGAMHAPFALGDRRQLLRLLRGAGAAGVEVSDGSVEFDCPAHIVSATKA
jgi:hypothetical protein